MLEKPDIPEQTLIAGLYENYGLQVDRLTFLPIGADAHTAVFRVDGDDQKAYFLKLRGGNFDEITTSVPQWLHALGVQPIIAPLETRSRGQWAALDAFKMILYPFIEGQDGYTVTLSDSQWVTFGSALRRIHTACVPPDLARLIPREDYSARWRNQVKDFQAQIEETTFEDPTAAKFADYMKAQRSEIDHLVGRADELGIALQSRPLEPVLCHSDIHPGNLLLGKDDTLYIVDWDAPVFAPKERDLLLIGGCYTWHGAREEALFYQGYGPVEIDRMALAYYRCERIIQDIAAFSTQLLASSEGGKDREQGLMYFTSNFLPGHEIELAFRTY
jgi:spectinomycin phosphotransferase